MTDNCRSSYASRDNTAGQRLALFLGEVLTDLQRDTAEARWPALRGARFPLIAVLCRTSSQMSQMHSALAAQGIEARLASAGSFFESAGVELVANILSVLEPRPDAIRLVGVLRSPLVGLNDAELFTLGQQLEFRWERLTDDPQLLDSLAAPLRAAIEPIAEWRRMLARLSPVTILDQLLRETDLLALLREAHEDEMASDVERCCELLHRTEAQSAAGLTASAALQWLLDRRVDGEGGVLPEDSHIPVVIMTTHAAKGLEFPMVVIPSLAPKVSSDSDFLTGFLDQNVPFVSIGMTGDDGTRSVRTVGDDVLREQEALRGAAEERRLFYVGCTRAREYLILSGKLPKAEHAAERSESPHELSDSTLPSRTPISWLDELWAREGGDAPTALTLRTGESSVSLPVTWIELAGETSDESEE